MHCEAECLSCEDWGECGSGFNHENKWKKHQKKKDRPRTYTDGPSVCHNSHGNIVKKFSVRSALYCNGWLYSHRKQGSEANGKPVTEAQFRSTFSNRIFSRTKPVTIRCNDGKIKFYLSWFEWRHGQIFPMNLKALNWGLKWSSRRGRSALYCMQCNGCALTQREGAIFSMLVDEDERPLGAHRNQVSSTARS